MWVIVVQACGILLFLAGSLGLGAAIRSDRSARAAERASRVSRALFWGALVAPGTVGLFHPGLTHYDALLGLPALPAPRVWVPVGALLLAAGAALAAASNRALARKGRGAAAFALTGRLVSDGPYARTRNPMSLGYYTTCAGLGPIAGSLAVTLGTILFLVSAHVVNLMYFEERELATRFGAAYDDYRRQVPFLLPRLRRS
jgi:protein-S-isoprenylcysteine O-methyltransferase Ste14